MENVNIFALGGQDENGKNCYVLEHNNNIYIINTGVKIPINSQNGVDTLIPDFSYLEKNKNKIQGVFISDIKNETFSALPWLVMKIPGLVIYTSAFNKVLILERLSKYNISDANYKVQVINQPIKLGQLTIKPFALSGSLPGNIGFDFMTKNGDYLFMFNFVEGNLGIYGKTYFKELRQFLGNNKINALVVDAGKSNFNSKAINKLNKSAQIDQAFENADPKAKIVVGAYDEEMVVLEQVLRNAKKYNRPVAMYGKTYAQLLYLITQVNNKLELPQIIDHKTINKTENVVVLVTGSIERLYARFLRITDNKDVYLRLNKADTVIMLAPPVNGLESLAAVTLDEIAKICSKIYDIQESEYFRSRPSKHDIYNLVKTLKPKTVIPAQGLYRYLVDASNYLMEDKELKKNMHPIILQNGKVVHYVDGNLFSLNGKVKEVGDTIIDGFGVGDISSEVIAERDSLGREGVIIINTLYSPKSKKIISKLHINYVGVIDETDQPEINKLIKSILIETFNSKQFSSMRELNEKVRKIIRKKIFKLTDKDPMVALTLTKL
ncbi:ribonuclease J [Mycoplasma sp. NEAQ87857]|uniref:ribonuclease J n=1 Tax=Mycoplasma sp. NEAQ87857 TaxID=2683967 RepID=UPI0013178746|nr:ribonuclease J [Mycoplasma sp. NEAQ87857]QGZ97638.1 ribonuclease J [Mycoplasma sp. NEAQ87857]